MLQNFQSCQEERTLLQNFARSPPPGPPPGEQNVENHSAYGQSTGLPPSHHKDEPAPPPYDPWMAVPDSGLMPPPPPMHQDRSPTANASDEDATRGHEWCRQNPLWQPLPPNPDNLFCLQAGEVLLTAGPNSHQVDMQHTGPGRTQASTKRNCSDSCFLSSIPLFYGTQHQFGVRQPLTIYYEVSVIAMGSGEGEEGIALGFVAPPYPAFRLPGWHRASVAVHGDDGHRYCDCSTCRGMSTQIQFPPATRGL